MAKNYLRRKSSIPAFILAGRDSVEVEEKDLRWRRSSHAAISAMLPSHGAFHSDTGLTLTRSIKDPQRRKSVAMRRRSIAAVRETIGRKGKADTFPTLRKLMKGVSTFDQWMAAEEDRTHIVESIKSMTASITVKKKYRPNRGSLQNIILPRHRRVQWTSP